MEKISDNGSLEKLGSLVEREANATGRSEWQSSSLSTYKRGRKAERGSIWELEIEAGSMC